MNIIKRDPLPSLNRYKNKEDFITKIIQKISVICRDNKSFTTNDKIKKLDENLNELKVRDGKLSELLNKSLKIKMDFQSQVSELEVDILNSKRKLLEFLGSEL